MTDNCGTIEDKDNMGKFFARLSREELEMTAVELYYDAARLREELDNIQGVIR